MGAGPFLYPEYRRLLRRSPDRESPDAASLAPRPPVPPRRHRRLVRRARDGPGGRPRAHSSHDPAHAAVAGRGRRRPECGRPLDRDAARRCERHGRRDSRPRDGRRRRSRVQPRRAWLFGEARRPAVRCAAGGSQRGRARAGRRDPPPGPVDAARRAPGFRDQEPDREDRRRRRASGRRRRDRRHRHREDEPRSQRRRRRELLLVQPQRVGRRERARDARGGHRRRDRQRPGRGRAWRPACACGPFAS